MTLRPLGIEIGKIHYGDIYQRKDNSGGNYLEVCFPLRLDEIIEANITKGRGYISSEEDYKKKNHIKFPRFLQDLREGHPDYTVLECCILSI